jgi:hypothetical protein
MKMADENASKLVELYIKSAQDANFYRYLYQERSQLYAALSYLMAEDKLTELVLPAEAFNRVDKMLVFHPSDDEAFVKITLIDVNQSLPVEGE